MTELTQTTFSSFFGTSIMGAQIDWSTDNPSTFDVASDNLIAGVTLNLYTVNLDSVVTINEPKHFYWYISIFNPAVSNGSSGDEIYAYDYVRGDIMMTPDTAVSPDTLSAIFEATPLYDKYCEDALGAACVDDTT